MKNRNALIAIGVLLLLTVALLPKPGRGQAQNFQPALLTAANSFSGLNTFTQQITSSIATGTAPFSIASTTNVANLNASSLGGATFAAPGAIGGTTPAAGTFTTVAGTTGTFSGAVSATTVTATGFITGVNKVFVTTDFTDSTSTTLGIITGLSWTLPTSLAANYSFHCSLLFDQASAAVSDQFGVGVTGTAPTNLSAGGISFSGTGAVATAGTLIGLASTTPTAVVTFTPSAITTVWNAELNGTIEQPSNATPGVFSIYASTTTGTDNLIVKRGSYCTLY